MADDAKQTGLTAKSEVQKTQSFRGYLLTVAFDIGTSSSSFAYAYKTSADKIETSLFETGGGFSEKVKAPTTVLTDPGPDGAFKSFGFEAEREYRELIAENEDTEYNLYTDFKMKIYREKNLHKTETKVKSVRGTAERTLLDLYVMTLKALSEEVMEDKRISGASVISKKEVRWVLCVPALWTDEAKDFLRHAAFKAELIKEEFSDQLLITLEATAAALYCQLPGSRFSAAHLEQKQVHVPEGTRYLVIDAGAGTVDYTALEVLGDGRVKEIAFANGGDWGARHVDQEFMELVETILGKEAIREFIEDNPEEWYDIQLSFEQAKCNAKPEAKSIVFNLPNQLYRFMSSREIDLANQINQHQTKYGVKEKKGHLTIDMERMKVLFEASIRQIAKKTSEMINIDLAGIEFHEIFLVGGFASSKLLQSHMQREFPQKRLSVPKDAQAAVVKGAVVYGLDPYKITRISRKTYGLGLCNEFDPKKHSEDKKVVIEGISYCDDLFSPIVQKREELEPHTHRRLVVTPLSSAAESMSIELYCIDRNTTEDEIIYTDSQEIELLTTTHLDMPNTEGGREREVNIDFLFEDEIRVIAEDTSSDNKENIKLTFDYDVRKS